MQYIFLSYFTAKKNIKHKFLFTPLTSRKHFFFIFQIYVNRLGYENPALIPIVGFIYSKYVKLIIQYN